MSDKAKGLAWLQTLCLKDTLLNKVSYYFVCILFQKIKHII